MPTRLKANMHQTMCATGRRQTNRKRRGWWQRQLRSWHWISAALSLIAMLFFAITGITLNHAASIPATPVITEQQAELPTDLLITLPADVDDDTSLPADVALAVRNLIGLDPSGQPAEWSADEIYVPLPRPGGDAWISIDRHSGEVQSEITRRGWISYANDLHKGRNSGLLWSWFIDIFAIASIIFTLTGLLLLYFQARQRRSTWPLVIAGTALPIFLILLIGH